MFIKEEYRDLFTVPEDYFLAQCISADFGMGAGIAMQFNRRFQMKSLLTAKYGDYTYAWDAQPNETGTAGFCLREGRVFNLITKRNCWDKPTYTALQNAVSAMKIQMEPNGITKLAMPRIGCGIDKLEWEKVRSIIEETFRTTDTDILVCNYKP